MVNSDDTFLERIISNISDSGSGIPMDEDFGEDEIKKLLTDSFKKGGNEGLIKEIEKYNLFMVTLDVDFPSNSSLVADLDWCIWFWKDEDIEEYTFSYIEYPDEYKIYLHRTSSAHRMYGQNRIELIDTYSLKTNIGEVFDQTVKDYMIGVFWNELESGLDLKGGQRFLSEMEEGEFSKDFNMGAFFNFDGIEIPQDIKDEAYKKILKNAEENNEEE